MTKNAPTGLRMDHFRNRLDFALIKYSTPAFRIMFEAVHPSHPTLPDSQYPSRFVNTESGILSRPVCMGRLAAPISGNMEARTDQVSKGVQPLQDP